MIKIFEKMNPKELVRVAFEPFSQKYNIRHELKLEFKPYTSMVSRLCAEGSSITIRLCDRYYMNFSDEVIMGAIQNLLNKYFRTKKQTPYILAFKDAKEDIRRVSAELQRRRGRKITSGTNGYFKSLEESFKRVNGEYFNGYFSKHLKPEIHWSMRKAKRTFGNYDNAHNVITISRIFDCAEIPDFVLDFIVYHELLHVKHKIREAMGRRVVHSRAFKEDEGKFKKFKEANEWLKKLAR